MPRKKTDWIVIHCSATTPSMDIGRKEIDRWHREEGFKMIGYHFVIRRDGSIEKGRDLMEAGAHVNPPAGINSTSVGICMVGGISEHNLPENNYTISQWTTLDKLVSEMQTKFQGAQVVGHNELAKKAGAPRACPCFDVQEWLHNRKPSERPLEGSGRPVLKQGDKSTQVKDLQRLLTAHGFTVVADGEFGPNTFKQVQAFQRAEGLATDGIVGPKTWDALEGSGNAKG